MKKTSEVRRQEKMPVMLRLIIAGVVILLLAAVLSYAAMESHPVSIDRLSQVHDGATPQDVEQLLGTPAHLNRSSSGDQWVYQRTLCWCIVTIRFNAKGVVTGVEHDH